MISFEYRVLSEYKIKVAKIDTLSKSIITHREPKNTECKDASEFLDVMINEIDQFYKTSLTLSSIFMTRLLAKVMTSISPSTITHISLQIIQKTVKRQPY